MVNTCLLYGATSWAGINLLIILIAMLLVAVFFAISAIFPAQIREKIKQAARSELTQAIISIVILLVLAVSATTICSAATTASNNLITGQTFASPFAYAEYYVGNLSVNTGLNLLTSLYSTSVSYTIEAQVLQSIGSLFNTKTSDLIPTFLSEIGLSSKILSLGIASALQLGSLFSTLAQIYIDVFAPLVTIAVGMLFLQFLLLPVLQYTAFAVVLPVAIAMRSLSFLGTPLRNASNAVLAMAIAAYIIYPTMLAFNGYAMAWIFSTANPSFQYLHTTYLLNTIPVNKFFTGVPAATYSGFFGTLFHLVYPYVVGSSSAPLYSFVNGAFSQNGGIIISPWAVVSQAHTIINEMSQFLFASVVLIVLDLAVTLGFAMGLAKALNSGLEGAGSFWGSL
ncbi:MAG: hypothetical protein ACREBH_02345 [Candidatus Micrarchaeaceae archaeon]